MSWIYILYSWTPCDVFFHVFPLWGRFHLSLMLDVDMTPFWPWEYLPEPWKHYKDPIDGIERQPEFRSSSKKMLAFRVLSICVFTIVIFISLLFNYFVWFYDYLLMFFRPDLESWVCLTVIALLTLASWGNPAYDPVARRKLSDACSDHLKPVATYVADLVLHQWRWMANNETIGDDGDTHRSFIVLLSCPVFELWEKDVLQMEVLY